MTNNKRSRKSTQNAPESDLRKTPPRGSSYPTRPKKKPRTVKGKKKVQPVDSPPPPDDSVVGPGDLPPDHGIDAPGGDDSSMEPAEPAEHREELSVILSPIPVRPAIIPRSTIAPGATQEVPIDLIDPIIRSSATPSYLGTPAPLMALGPTTPAPGGTMTPAPGATQGGKPPRVKWTDMMEEVLLQALEEIVKRGKTADGFKAEHWNEVAEKVRKVYTGKAMVIGKNCKSKYEIFRKSWSLWQDYLGSGLSGWEENEEGLPQSSEEVMDAYFSEHPEFKAFRFNFPPGYKYLVNIVGDRVATGEFAIDARAEDSDEVEWASDISDEGESGKSEDDEIQPSIERSQSVSVSRSSSVSTAAQRRNLQKEHQKEQAKGGMRKHIAAQKMANNKRDEEDQGRVRKKSEKKSDLLARSLSEFDGQSAKVLEGFIKKLDENIKNPIQQAIELFDKELAEEFEEEVYQVLSLLQDEAKASALLAMKPERRAGWIRYELGLLE